jgi:diaminobutyrate-2-oxoglutarate transaminase
MLQPSLSRDTAVADNAFFLARQARFESNVRSYPRKLPLAIAKAAGVWVTDVEGKTYLDCLAGAGTLALGHNHPAVTAAITDFLGSGLPMHSLDLTTPLKDAFSERLLGLLPGRAEDYCLQFCGPSGADAVEAALKLAKKVTGRSNVVAFSGGYHGMTHGALAVTGNLAPKQGVAGLMPGVQFLPYPHEYRCPLGLGGEQGAAALAGYLERFFGDVESGVCRPAAVIVEAVQGEGGVNPAPAAWLRTLRQVTRAHGILLIVDEVQTGFGRTGALFACQHAGIEPDILVLSKAVGGGLPLALLAIRREFDAWESGGHTGTFRGNQLAMATGLATLEVIERDGLVSHAAQLGGWLRRHLERLRERFPVIGNVRGLGLMLGLEIVEAGGDADALGSLPADPALAAAIQRHCFAQGLLLERGGRDGNVVRLLPPLILQESHCLVLLERLEAALVAALAEPRG